jgi:transcription antitermination factor NusG
MNNIMASNKSMGNKRWYAVYIKNGSARKLTNALSRWGIEHLYAGQQPDRPWYDKRGTAAASTIFDSYIFVNLSVEQHNQVLKLDGVVNFVYWLDRPAVIKEMEIEMIKNFLNDYENIKIEKTFVNVKDMVRVVSGPAIDQKGNVLAVKSKTIKVVLPSLGCTMSAEIREEQAELITQKLNYFAVSAAVAASN